MIENFILQQNLKLDTPIKSSRHLIHSWLINSKEYQNKLDQNKNKKRADRN